MNPSVASPYTPPPPPHPDDAPSSTLRALDFPLKATPLPPIPSRTTSTTSTHAAAASSAATQPSPASHIPQIRYCYFIPAASLAPPRSRNPSLSRKPVFLTPHVQDPMDLSPNSTQPPPRSSDSSHASISALHVLGPHPPQIQLQFLEDQPLPPPTISESSAQSSDVVLVERKDSGYGGSITRSSSLATFGRSIRKVFLRHSHRGSIDTVVMADPPVLDCGISQDVLDHENWALDLAQRLTLAAAPDAVTTWLGQLPVEVSMPPRSTTAQEHPEETADAKLLNSGQDRREHGIDLWTETELAEAAQSSILPRSKSELTMNLLLGSSVSPSDGSSSTARPTAGKSLRKVLSLEHLDKPQPPLPLNTLSVLDSKPVPALPVETKPAVSNTSPLNSLAQRLTGAAELGLGKACVKNTSNNRRRPKIHEIFQESVSESIISYKARESSECRWSGESIEELLDGPPSEPGPPTTASPEDFEGEHYLAIKPSSMRSTRFFKSWTALSAAEIENQSHDVRPHSEVLLSNSILSLEEISAEVATVSRSTSLRSPNTRRAIPQWGEQSPATDMLQYKEQSSTSSLVPPRPLFYSRGVASSVTSLGETSTCGSVDSSVVDSSADEWDGLSRMAQHAREQNARYNADLKELQALLYKADPTHRFLYTPMHSANTSTGSLTLPSIPPLPTKKGSKPAKRLSKKDDYMSHRMSACSPKLLPVVGKAKPRSKSRLSMTYGGGELEVVKHAKFDTPEAIARNKEIRKFISQEIHTTEVNYLQYLRIIQEVFVEPLLRSLETDKPIIPKSNPLFQLLSHISALTAVSSQISQRLGDCVLDEVWSDESSMIGTIFLDVKDSLSIFLKYGQSYGKGMKALRTLMKSKRTSISAAPFFSPVISPTDISSKAPMAGGPRMDKRRSLPAIFSLNSAPGAPSSALLESTGSKSNTGSDQANVGKSNTGYTSRSNHGTLTTIGEFSEYQHFLRNCVGGKETTSRFSLTDLLILPIQRVTRYCLLLKDLKKHTDVEHQDYICIVHALEQLHTLALATNNVQPLSMRQ